MLFALAPDHQSRGFQPHAALLQGVQACSPGAQHGAEQLGGFGTADQRAFFSAMRHGGEVTGLYLGRIIDPGGHAMRDQVEQKAFFASRWAFEQFNQFRSLLCG